jgi:hypothetical protein
MWKVTTHAKKHNGKIDIHTANFHKREDVAPYVNGIYDLGGYKSIGAVIQWFESKRERENNNVPIQSRDNGTSSEPGLPSTNGVCKNPSCRKCAHLRDGTDRMGRHARGSKEVDPTPVQQAQPVHGKCHLGACLATPACYVRCKRQPKG